MNILIVEDDKKLTQTYITALSDDFDVEVVNSLRECKHYVQKTTIDLVLLDIMLPDGRGYEVISWLKKQRDMIVIVISALEQEETRRIAYENGADDYMIKPITLFELEYKLKAHKKRFGKEKMVIQIGDMTLNLEKLMLSTISDEVLIQHSQGIVLKMLYDKYKTGDILTKTELSRLDEIEKTDNFRIHTLLSRLRKNIEKINSELVFIETVYGEGYRLVVMK